MPVGISRFSGLLAGAGLATAVLFASDAFAQTAGPVVGVPTRDELRGLRVATDPERGSLSIEGGIERSPCPLADPRYADIKVRISHVTFGNLKGATEAELAPAWHDFAGTEQPVAALCEIRDAAATILRNKGYLAAVQVPTQRIESGEVRLEVLYARVTAIRARGETRGAETKLQQYLAHLTQSEVFNRIEAERYLLLARDLPGYNVQLTLKPAGTGVGDLIGEVTVLRRPYVVDLTIQNLSSIATGRWGAQVRAQVFGLTGMGDATSVAFYSTADTREQKILELGHEFRPGGEGLKVEGLFTYAWTRPNLGSAALPGVPALRARTLFATLGAHYPVVRTQARNLTLGGGFDFLNQKVDLIGTLTQDKLRVAWLRASVNGVDLARREPAWRYSATLELRQGLDVLDATKGCIGLACVTLTPTSRADGSPTATTVRFASEAQIALGRSAALVLAPRAQYAFGPVFAFEEFTAGNYTVGRGYDPGTLTGDSGVGLAAELRGPRFLANQARTLTIQPYVFGDAAWAWTKNLPGSQRLTSAGGGLRAEWGDRFRLDAALAVPLERAGVAATRGSARFLITLTTRLLPWRTR